MLQAGTRLLAAICAACALLSPLAGCGGGTEVRVGFNQPPPAATGMLAVTIANLPAEASAAVRVTAPGNFSRELVRSETLSGLVPGTYTVNAGPVTFNAVTYAPATASQSVSVQSGATAQVRVEYAAAPLTLATTVFATGLDRPVFLTAPPGDPRQFIVERAGRIRVVENGNLLAAPFLDISARVSTDGEGGLLSMAFDPAYATNGRFYIYYTDFRHDIVVEQHTVSGNPNVANGTGQLEVIRIAHPTFVNHFGGLVAFGPDGYLYLATGDGGGAGDPSGNAQNNAVLLGKILRLDVSAATIAAPYRIPPSNPFVNQAGARGEIWASGLRNPWRFAFDAGRIYVADVGQDQREEINVADSALAGVNYGWDIMEGSDCFGAAGCATAGLTRPALEYLHGATSAAGCSVTGGYVYRGRALPELAGHYFYSDFCAGFVRSFAWSGTAATQQASWPLAGLSGIVSFGQDAEGELYLVSEGGTIFKIVRAASAQ